MKQLILTLAILVAPITATAEMTKGPYATAVEARVSGRPDIALQILGDLEQAHPLSAQIKFEKGVALAQMGQCASAARTFNRGRALTDHPSFARAAEDAMNDLCPKLARFETSVYGQLTIQSNANGGSETDTVTLNGTTYTLSEDAMAQRGSQLRFGGQVAYNLPLSHQHYFVPHAAIDVKLQEHEPELTITPEVGLSYRYRGDRSEFRVGPSIGRTFEDGDLVSDHISIEASGSYTINPRSALLYSASFTHKDFNGTTATEDVAFGSLAYIRQIDQGRKSIKVALSHRDTDATNYMNDLTHTTLSASLTGSFNQRYGYEVFASHGWIEGDITDPVFGVRRSDNVMTVGANLSLPFGDNILGRPYVGIQHTRSRSSFETKNYSNTGLTFGFTRSF